MVSTNYSFSRINGPDSLNVISAGNQSDPALVTFGNGAGAVFFDAGNTIAARLINAAGEPTGAQVQVSSGASAFEPEAVLLSNGNIAVVWQEGGTNIRARIYSPDLQPVGAAISVLTGSSTNPFARPDIAATADGGFVIVSDYKYASDDYDIYIKKYDSAGVSVASRQISPPSTVDYDPSVAVLSNGNIALAFGRQGPTSTALWSAVYAPSLTGTAVQAPVLLDGSTISNYEPHLVAKPDGTYLLTYTNSQSGYRYVVSRTMSPTGASLDFEGTGSGFVIDGVGSAVSPDGNSIVVGAYYSSSYDILGTLLLANGNTAGFNAVLEAVPGDQGKPSVKWLNTYAIELAYSTSQTTPGTDGDGYGIVVSRYLVVRTHDRQCQR